MFCFQLALAHACLQTVVNARRISNNQGRAVVSLCFGNGFKGLVLIRAHGDLRYINIAVAHGHHAEVFFAGAFAAGRKFGNSRSRSSLGGLAAGVGIYFGIKYHYVNVFAAGKNMVKSAVADIVSPAVAAENPVAAFYKVLAEACNFF